MLFKNDIPAESILTEALSVDTIGNIYYTKLHFLIPNEWKNITIVTSKFHLKRSKYLAEKILGPEYKIKFIATKNGIPFHKLLYQHKIESKLLNLAKLLLDPITDGDDESVGQMIHTKHPGYAKKSKHSIEELMAMAGHQWHHITPKRIPKKYSSHG